MNKQTVLLRCGLSTLKKIHEALYIAQNAEGFRPEYPAQYFGEDDEEYQAEARQKIREGEELAFELFYTGAQQLDPSGRLAMGF